MKWKALYSGDRIFTSETTKWDDLPDDGALIFVEYQKGGRRIVDGGDWYWPEDGTIKYVPSKSWDVEEPKPTVGCTNCIKKGRAIDDAAFYELYRRVRYREV